MGSYADPCLNGVCQGLFRLEEQCLEAHDRLFFHKRCKVSPTTPSQGFLAMEEDNIKLSLYWCPENVPALFSTFRKHVPKS